MTKIGILTLFGALALQSYTTATNYQNPIFRSVFDSNNFGRSLSERFFARQGSIYFKVNSMKIVPKAVEVNRNFPQVNDLLLNTYPPSSVESRVNFPTRNITTTETPEIVNQTRKVLKLPKTTLNFHFKLVPKLNRGNFKATTAPIKEIVTTQSTLRTNKFPSVLKVVDVEPSITYSWNVTTASRSKNTTQSIGSALEIPKTTSPVTFKAVKIETLKVPKENSANLFNELQSNLSLPVVFKKNHFQLINLLPSTTTGAPQPPHKHIHLDLPDISKKVNFHERRLTLPRQLKRNQYQIQLNLPRTSELEKVQLVDESSGQHQQVRRHHNNLLASTLPNSTKKVKYVISRPNIDSTTASGMNIVRRVIKRIRRPVNKINEVKLVNPSVE